MGATCFKLTEYLTNKEFINFKYLWHTSDTVEGVAKPSCDYPYLDVAETNINMCINIPKRLCDKLRGSKYLLKHVKQKTTVEKRINFLSDIYIIGDSNTDNMFNNNNNDGKQMAAPGKLLKQLFETRIRISNDKLLIVTPKREFETEENDHDERFQQTKNRFNNNVKTIMNLQNKANNHNISINNECEEICEMCNDNNTASMKEKEKEINERAQDSEKIKI